LASSPAPACRPTAYVSTGSLDLQVHP
jgi:hypothetical protein